MLRTMITDTPFEQRWVLQGRLCNRWAADLKERWEAFWEAVLLGSGSRSRSRFIARRNECPRCALPPAEETIVPLSHTGSRPLV
jgi:hypothetical protein